MTIKEYRDFDLEEIVRLYESVGWTNYCKRAELLERAFQNSLCVLAAYENDELLGVIRAVGDGLTIVLIQDILVFPRVQRRGVGTALVRSVMDRYESVYQLQLATDRTEKTFRFYESLGFRSYRQWGCEGFMRMADAPCE